MISLKNRIKIVWEFSIIIFGSSAENLFACSKIISFFLLPVGILGSVITSFSIVSFIYFKTLAIIAHYFFLSFVRLSNFFVVTIPLCLCPLEFTPTSLKQVTSISLSYQKTASVSDLILSIFAIVTIWFLTHL